MVEAPASVLGGLPCIAEVVFTRGDGWTTDDDAEVQALYWMKRDGTKGAPFSEAMFEKLNKKDPYWESDVIEKVTDHIAYEQYEREQLEKAQKLAGGRVDYDAVKAAWDKIFKECEVPLG